MRSEKCLLVLVPHRDSRLPLRAWSASLFAAGLPGAWSFPWVAPLAVLRRPLPGERLKSLACAVRRQVSQSGGKFIAGAPTVACLSGDKALSVFGLSLNIGLPVDFFEPDAAAVLRSVSPLVIGSALVHHSSLHIPHCPLPPPPVSFRAAALANMSLRPLSEASPLPVSGDTHDGLSFEWEIGKLYWLPKTGIGE